MSQSASDIEFLRNRYAVARNKYKPATLRTLLIAEAPPCSLDRFFYFEEVPKQDSLFLETVGVIYPDLKAAYLKSRRDPELKKELLEHFQSDGYWMIDLSEVPHELTGESPESALPGLLERVKKVADKKTNIILIKSNVYDCVYPALSELGYSVSNERIPFPGSGQQGVFRERFARALKLSD